MVGTKGGLSRLARRSSQWTCRKNACFLTSSASRSLAPRRLSGFFRSNWKFKAGKFKFFPYCKMRWEMSSPSAWWRWLPVRGIEDSELRRWRYCQRLPPHRRQGTATRRPASQRWGRRGPTSRRPWCTSVPSAPRAPRIRAFRRRCPSGRRIPFLPCTVQNRRFSRSLRCPAVNCPTLNLCAARKGTHARAGTIKND